MNDFFKMMTLSAGDDDAFLADLIAGLDEDHQTIRRDVQNKIKDAAFRDHCLKALDAEHEADKAALVASYCGAAAHGAAHDAVRRDANAMRGLVADANRLSAHAARLRAAADRLHKAAEPFVAEVLKR
jgi:hypothetical protein